jgi:hypothetical protein
LRGSKNEEILKDMNNLSLRVREFVGRKKIMIPAAGAFLWANAPDNPMNLLNSLVQTVIDEFDLLEKERNSKSRQNNNNSSSLLGGRGKNFF